MIRVLLLETKGSVPRPAGTVMQVWPDRIEGTIGGGALEWEIMRAARAMTGAQAQVLRFALGPSLGQCCGGSVTALLEPASEPLSEPLSELRPVLKDAAPRPPLVLIRAQAKARSGAERAGPLFAQGWLYEPATAPAAPLWVWGAGHIGRALVAMLAPIETVALTWVDFAPDRFPALPDRVTQLVAQNPADLAPFAPETAHHLILTHSHALDLDLCHRLLARGFASLGMIGAQTKAARFRGRLRDLGHSSAQISRIACPIGDLSLGKHPSAIAIGIAQGLLRELSAARAPMFERPAERMIP